MIPRTVSHLIGGQPVRSALGKTYPVPDPASGKEYAQVAVGVGGDVSQAVLAARTALATGPWAGVTAGGRARVLHAIADAVDARAADVVAAEALGSGLPAAQARDLAAQAAAAFRDAAGQIPAGGGDRADPDSPSYQVSGPAGVAGLITSWRTPFLAQARALAPALAAGCTAVLKPDEWAPLPAALLAEIVSAAEVPAGVVNIVHGSLHPRAAGTQARDALIAHPLVDRLSFAGDAASARQVQLEAAGHGKPLWTEPDGHAPLLVLPDADLDQAVDAAAFGAFALNGQRRTATSLVLAHRAVYETVVSRLAEWAGRTQAGAADAPGTRLGPVAHPGHYSALAAGVRAAVRDGARLAAGGRRPPGLPEGNYLAATVLADVTPAMTVFTEPLDGPVVHVIPFDTDDQAADLANAVPGAGMAYLWTASRERARRLAAVLDQPTLWVNDRNPGDQAGQAGLGFFTRTRTVHDAGQPAGAAPAPPWWD